ncbi:MAG TPA: ABC transporter permease subunit, partial [Actinomycetota bacterium]|nr:ABC transporter permease subunit [Actinomycetota bacterium]
VYPLIDTIAQSFQTADTRQFVGLDNYRTALGTERVVTSIRNTVVWVAVAPALITGLGLVFALLTERVRYGTAVKVLLFMPMAISFLSIGVIWRVMYEQDPDRGLINAATGAVVDTVRTPGPYPEATALADSGLERRGDVMVSSQRVSPGETLPIGLVSITDPEIPPDATQATEPEARPGDVAVVVWRDFKPGGGRPGVVEEGELGLPGATVELLDSQGEVVASQVTASDGSATFSEIADGSYTARLGEATFRAPYDGASWLASSLVTPAIIGAFLWAQVGFAVVVMGAGLAALPRDLLEAARVDGATEMQVFRHITVPLMRPIITVVFITLLINTLKVFDIVYVLAPPSSQNAANVIALEMFRTSFLARNFGVGAAVAVILFLAVVPIMIVNVRRFRREG